MEALLLTVSRNVRISFIPWGERVSRRWAGIKAARAGDRSIVNC